MAVASNLKHVCNITYMRNNVLLPLSISDTYRQCDVSILNTKLDTGANDTVFDFNELSRLLMITEDDIMDTCNKRGLKPICIVPYKGLPIVAHPVIIPETVLGDFEIRNWKVYTILDSTKLRIAKEITSIDSIDSIEEANRIVAAYLNRDIDNLDNSDLSLKPTCLMGQNILQHLNYDVRLEGLEIEPYEDDCDEFIFKPRGKFFFDTIDSSKRVFKNRYKRYMNGETDLFWMLSIEDMQEIDRNTRGKYNSNGISALGWK